MAVIPETPEGLFVRDDDEGLFSRDLNGSLVRLDAPTQADYDKQVTLEIDGQSVTVPLAEPLQDANGNVVQDLEGRTTPRYTTIYDAALKLYVHEAGDEVKIPIPTLCHLPHMKPVAVCRLCVVQIYGQKRGKRAAERKLLPACQHPVKNGMEVFTMNAPGPDGERVRQSVKVVTELLAADHLKPAPHPEVAKELSPFNELAQMADRCGASTSRFKLDVLSVPPPVPPPRAGRRELDSSSPVFTVDHSACILCDRCVRACDEVMENNVIGRTGKGNTAGIGFDLNEPMGNSTCVQCGECMVSCPTSAITFKPVATVKPVRRAGRAEIISAAELLRDPVFAGMPPKFLLWQKGLVVRRELRSGQVLCRKDEPGNTAFIIKSGALEVLVELPGVRPSGGLFAGMLGMGRGHTFRARLTPADVIAGEMACLSGSARSADVKVVERAEIWEVRRNVLDRLMRLPSRRARFEASYRDRSLDLVLQSSELFRGLEHEQYKKMVDFLRERLSFVRVRPGQVLFRQGEMANELYLVRLGHVRVGIQQYQNEVRVLTRGPGTIFGEIGLLALSARDTGSLAGTDRSATARRLGRCGRGSWSTPFLMVCGRRLARRSITWRWRGWGAGISSSSSASFPFCAVGWWNSRSPPCAVAVRTARLSPITWTRGSTKAGAFWSSTWISARVAMSAPRAALSSMGTRPTVSPLPDSCAMGAALAIISSPLPAAPARTRIACRAVRWIRFTGANIFRL